MQTWKLCERYRQEWADEDIVIDFKVERIAIQLTHFRTQVFHRRVIIFIQGVIKTRLGRAFPRLIISI